MADIFKGDSAIAAVHGAYDLAAVRSVPRGALQLRR
jgi:hypothetical protein